MAPHSVAARSRPTLGCHGLSDPWVPRTARQSVPTQTAECAGVVPAKARHRTRSRVSRSLAVAAWGTRGLDLRRRLDLVDHLANARDAADRFDDGDPLILVAQPARQRHRAALDRGVESGLRAGSRACQTSRDRLLQCFVRSGISAEHGSTPSLEERDAAQKPAAFGRGIDQMAAVGQWGIISRPQSILYRHIVLQVGKLNEIQRMSEKPLSFAGKRESTVAGFSPNGQLGVTFRTRFLIHSLRRFLGHGFPGSGQARLARRIRLEHGALRMNARRGVGWLSTNRTQLRLRRQDDRFRFLFAHESSSRMCRLSVRSFKEALCATPEFLPAPSTDATATDSPGSIRSQPIPPPPAFET